MDQIHISAELVIIGGGASLLAEFLRALILKIEDYPRLAAIWKYLPIIFGMIGVLLFPSAVPNVSTLILLAHGAASPAVFYIAYPLIKAVAIKKLEAALPGEIAQLASEKGPTPPALPDKKEEGDLPS